MVYVASMITIDIDKLKSPYYDIIVNFYKMNLELPNKEYIEKFEKEFRCRASARDDCGWDMIFKDEDYTWFLLRWA